MSGFDWLVCPHCREPLVVGGRTAGCPTGHRFDLARQGYLNLMGRAPGANADSARMLAQRDAFLSAGHYQPIVDAIIGAVGTPARVLEVGAGTGHYLAAVLDALPGAEGLGLDVSPAAARRLARVHPRMRAIVADAWQPLPLADGCVEVVLSVFAPRNPSEFARVLGPSGTLVTVTPGPGHLVEARQRFGLIGVQDDKSDRLAEGLAGHFTPVSTTRVRFVLDLSAEAAEALVGMGPNALHEHAAVEALRVTVEVQASTWRVLA